MFSSATSVQKTLTPNQALCRKLARVAYVDSTLCNVELCSFHVCVDVTSPRDLIGSRSATRSAATEKLSWTQLQAATPEVSMTAAAAPRGVPLEVNAFFFFHRHHIWSECSLKSKPGSLYFPDTEFILLLLCAATLQKPHVK